MSTAGECARAVYLYQRSLQIHGWQRHWRWSYNPHQQVILSRSLIISKFLLIYHVYCLGLTRPLQVWKTSSFSHMKLKLSERENSIRDYIRFRLTVYKEKAIGAAVVETTAAGLCFVLDAMHATCVRSWGNLDNAEVTWCLQCGKSAHGWGQRWLNSNCDSTFETNQHWCGIFGRLIGGVILVVKLFPDWG